MADYTIEPGQNLDLTDPDDPVVEEDGEVVREPEPAEDDSGGGGGGGSDTEPEPDDTSGDSRDETTSVVVTGDPGSSEGITTVGQGDTLEEARTDAATNPDFDADEGEEVDRVEEQLGTDQPGINPEDQASDRTSVVVAGDPGSTEGITTVGQAQTLRGARTQAALNQNFDAAQGEPVDAIETRIGAGQGSGTTLQALNELQERNQTGTGQKNFSTSSAGPQRNYSPAETREENLPETLEDPGPGFFQDAQQAYYRSQVREEQLTENQREFKEASNPDIPVLGNLLTLGGRFGRESVDVVQGLAQGDGEKARESFIDAEEEFQIQGMGILAQGQEFAEDVGDRLDKQEVDPRFPGTEQLEKAGIIAEYLGFEQGEQVTETARQLERDIIQGTATGGSAAGGIAVAAPGALSENLRGTLQNAGVEQFQEEGEEATGFGEALVGGSAMTAEEFTENPVEFTGSEVGEEIAETAGGFLIGGTAGAAAGAAPTITPEVTPDTTLTRGDVLNPSDVKARAKDTGRSIYRGITDPNAVGSGPGALLPAESRPGSEPSPSRPDNGRSRTDPRNERPEKSRTGQDRYQELQEYAQSDPRRTEGFGTDVRGEFNTEDVVATEQELTTETSTQAQETDTTGIDFTGTTGTVPTLEDDVGVDSRPEPDVETLPETDPEVITETKPETEPETTPETTPEVVPEVFTEPETQLETRPEITPDFITEPERSPDPSPDSESSSENSDSVLGDLVGSEQEFERTTSVAADLLDLESERGESDEFSAGNPLNLRPDLN